MFGFGMTVAVAKKRDPTMFAKVRDKEEWDAANDRSVCRCGDSQQQVIDFSLSRPSQGLIGSRNEVAAESGGRLAMRALGWGTLYSVTGFSVFCYAVWKLIGARDVRMKKFAF